MAHRQRGRARHPSHQQISLSALARDGEYNQGQINLETGPIGFVLSPQTSVRFEMVADFDGSVSADDTRVLRVPFQRIRMESGKHFSFDVEDRYGNTRMIPFHRIREVWRDDALIWQRAGPE